MPATLMLIVFSMALSGCFDYSEQIWLRSDGSARIETVLKMKDHLSSFGSDGDLPFGTDREFEDGSGKVWTERKDGQVITHLEADVSDFRKSGTLAPGDFSRGKMAQDWYTIESLGLGRYRLLRTVSLPGSDARDRNGSKSNEGSPLGEMGQALGYSLMDQMLAGHEFSVTLHAPLILSSNADTQRGNSATWKRDMTQLAGGKGEALTIEATVLLLDYKLLAIVGGVILLLLILLAVLVRRKKRKPQAAASSVDSPGAGLE